MVRPLTHRSGQRVRSAAVLSLVLLVLLALPGVHAEGFRLSSPRTVEGELGVPGDPGTLDDGFLLFSGALDHEATFRGPVFAMDSRPGSHIAADTIRVYRSDDPASFALQRPLHETLDGRLVPDTGSAYYWALPEAQVSAHPDYTFSFLYQLEGNLPEMGPLLPPRDGPAPPSLIAQATDTPWRFDAPGTERSIFLTTHGGFTVTAPDGTTEHFAGPDWIVTLRGATEADLGATGIAVPFEGSQTTLRPAEPDHFQNGFSVARLQGFLGLATRLASGFEPPKDLPDEGSLPGCEADPRACLEDGQLDKAALLEQYRSLTEPQTETAPQEGDPVVADPLPPEAAEALVALAPMLNGALFGNPNGVFQVAGTTTDTPGFTLMRYETLTLKSAGADSVAFSGTTPFAYTGGDVHHDTETVQVGPVVIPILSIGLYVIAIGAWAATRFWKARPLDEPLTRRLRVPALVSQWGLLAVSFALFDREVHYLLGESLLSSLGLYGTPATIALAADGMALSGTSLILVLQLGFWAAAMGAFGVPMALLGRAGLKGAGIGRPAYGLAIGLGALATWLLGTATILPLLDIAFAAVSGAAA